MNAAALVEALEFAVFFNDGGIDVRRMVQIREHAPVVHGLQQLYAQQGAAGAQAGPAAGAQDGANAGAESASKDDDVVDAEVVDDDKDDKDNK